MAIILVFEQVIVINDLKGFPGGLVVKNSPAMQEPQETRVQSLGQEDPLEEGMAIHSKYSCLENPMDKGAWWATVPGVTKVRYNLAIKPSTIKGIKDHRNKRLQKEN